MQKAESVSGGTMGSSIAACMKMRQKTARRIPDNGHGRSRVEGRRIQGTYRYPRVSPAARTRNAGRNARDTPARTHQNDRGRFYKKAITPDFWADKIVSYCWHLLS